MEDVARWTGHSAMTDLGRYDALVAELPSRVDALSGVVQGVLIHTDWLDAYGVDISEFDGASRNTLPIAERLSLVLERDARAIPVARPPARRTVGTCRDFALMLCAFLRGKGIAARLRCGFADYLTDGWEDHWVCEYWDRDALAWRLADAQMDEVLRTQCRIAFDPADVPGRAFMTAGQAWTACRAGKCDPDRIGHGALRGLWFVKVNVVRDHYAINNREISAWDSWRGAPASRRVVSDADIALLDSLAIRPEQPVVEVAPDWPT